MRFSEAQQTLSRYFNAIRGQIEPVFGKPLRVRTVPVKAQSSAKKTTSQESPSKGPRSTRPQTKGPRTKGARSTAQKPRRAQPTGPRLVAETTGLMVKNIGKSFNGRPVVRGVSMELQRGEVLGLLGPNGAGKTTSFYMITGLVPADYGQIELDGHEITGLPMYRRARFGIGYLL